MRTIVAIQYLRAIASFGVVLFHLSADSGRWFYIGQAGVDAFFIISGFIMWTLTEERETSPRDFLTHRIARIVPLYWGVTLLYAVCNLYAPAVIGLWHPSGTRLLLSLLFVPDRAGGFAWPVLVLGWTINIEMFFYAAFAASLLAPRRLQLILLSGALLGLAAVGHMVASRNALFDTYTNSRLAEFVAGLLLGWAWTRRLVPGFRAGVALLALGTGLLAWQQWRVTEPGGWVVLFWGVPCLLAIAGALAVEAAGRLPRIRLLKRLGDASYAIYLAHLPVVNWLNLRLHAPVPVKIILAVLICGTLGILLHPAEMRATAAARRVLAGGVPWRRVSLPERGPDARRTS